MRLSFLRSAVLIPVALVAATPALAQRRDEYVECFRDGRRVTCESENTRRERERDRERALERAREARERAAERAAETRERALERTREQQRQRLEQQRVQQRELDRRREYERQRQLDRQRDARRSVELARERTRLAQRRYYDDLRPRLTLGGGADLRRFDATNRYVVHGGIDFRGRSGIGMRPEVMFGWTDRQTELLASNNCPGCNSVPVQFTTRSKLLGVNLNATYSLLRRSWVRPYVLGGVGVLATRETTPEIASATPIPGTGGSTSFIYRAVRTDHVDLGLNAGAGLEFGLGPVHLFSEFRYFLNDRSTARGFSGMLPITAGLRF